MSGLTKFFYHDMKGAPELKAEWGSLLNVIRTVTIDGFNPQTPLSIDIVDGECTVTFDELEPHGFIEHQVINISGAIESEFNGEYRLTSVNNNTITFNTVFVGVITSDVTIKTAGMGWTEKFSGENKAVFTAKDTVKNPFYLRVDNSCPVGYDTTWAKFARVTISNGINDIDNYDGFEKAPTSPQHPDTNENGNGVSGVGGLFGWAKWYHGVETIPYLCEISKNQTPFSIPEILEWEIYGDDVSIYLYIQITESNGRANYNFTPIYSIDGLSSVNCMLSSTDGLRKPSENGESELNSSNCSWVSNTYGGKYILYDYLGNSNNVNECGVFSLNIGNNSQVSGYSNDIPINSEGVLLHDIFIKEKDSGIVGKLPLIKWVHNKWIYGKAVTKYGTNSYIICESGYGYFGMVSAYGFKL